MLGKLYHCKFPFKPANFLCSSLNSPVSTFTVACVHYHKFRLAHKDNEYQYQDASAAALLTACKIEDTLKKSKDILCAAHNLKVPAADHLSPDDIVSTFLPLFHEL